MKTCWYAKGLVFLVIFKFYQAGNQEQYYKTFISLNWFYMAFFSKSNEKKELIYTLSSMTTTG